MEVDLIDIPRFEITPDEDLWLKNRNESFFIEKENAKVNFAELQFLRRNWLAASP